MSPLIALSLVACMILCTQYAHASQENIPVLQRTQPATNPVGARAGGLMLYPSVTLMENFDSNIYAAGNNKKSDFITQILPALNLHTLDKQKGFRALLTSDHGYYKSRSRENYNDYKASFSPYWTITRALTMRAHLSWEKEHEQRNDPDALQNNASRRPVTYNRTAGSLGWDYKRGRIGLKLSGERAYIDFDNGQTIAGMSLINDDRNRFENAVAAELSCDLTDRTTLYWTSKWLNREYKRPDFEIADYTGAERDSNGYEKGLGLRLDVTPLVSIDTQIGYRTQNFNDSSYKDIGSGVGKFNLTWMVTPLTTIDIGGYRNILETNQTDSSGYAQTHIGTTIAHELRRDVILQAEGGVGKNDYIGINRNDNYWTAGAGATYKMNRWLHWRAAYFYEERDSDIAAAVYTKHRVFLSTSVQF